MGYDFRVETRSWYRRQNFNSQSEKPGVSDSYGHTDSPPMRLGGEMTAWFFTLATFVASSPFLLRQVVSIGGSL